MQPQTGCTTAHACTCVESPQQPALHEQYIPRSQTCPWISAVRRALVTYVILFVCLLQWQRYEQIVSKSTDIYEQSFCHLNHANISTYKGFGDQDSDDLT